MENIEMNGKLLVALAMISLVGASLYVINEKQFGKEEVNIYSNFNSKAFLLTGGSIYADTPEKVEYAISRDKWLMNGAKGFNE